MGIFLVIEVQKKLTIDHANAGGGNIILKGQFM
jgi:hypothetical protein